MQLYNPFQKKDYGTIGSFLCEGGIQGKTELKISKTIYPPDWDGAKDSKAKTIIEINKREVKR